VLKSVDSALAFHTMLFELVTRLARDGIVVSSLHCDWSSFGSWALEAQRGLEAEAYAHALLDQKWDSSGPEVFRVSWDGRERVVATSKASTPPLSSPGPWTSEPGSTFDDPESGMLFAEARLKSWYRR
jgi:hypothetical protein